MGRGWIIGGKKQETDRDYCNCPEIMGDSDLDWSSGHGDWGEKAYGFRMCFGGRSDRTFAGELDMRDKRVDKRSRVTPRFLA